MVTGGVRVSKIVEHPEFNQGNDIETIFQYLDEVDKTRSSGEALPMRKLFDYQIDVDFPTNPFVLISSRPYRESSTDWIRYKSVTVKQVGNGSTVYNFTSHSSNPDEPAERFYFSGIELSTAYQPYFSDEDNDAGAPNSDMSYDRGLVTKISIYNENEDKLQETVFTYNFNPPHFVPKEVMALRTSSSLNLFGHSNHGANADRLEFYKHKSSFHILTQKETKNFDISSGSHLSEITNYEYNLARHIHLKKVSIENSNGDIYSTQFKYPSDYSLPPNILHSSPITEQKARAIGLMYIKNINNVPVETITKITNSNGTFVTSAKLTEFKIFSIATFPLLKPFKTFSLDISTPISNFVESTIDNSLVFNCDSRYFLENSNDLFDGKGNLLVETNAPGISNSFIYDNECPFIVAKVQNAKYVNNEIGNECSYTGFEVQSISNTDYWVHNLPGGTIFQEGHTGMNSFKFTSGQFASRKDFKPENQNQKFRFSCFVKTQNGYAANQGQLILYSKRDDNIDNSTYPNISGAYVSVPFGDTQGKWQYIEGIIDLGQIRAMGGINSTELLQIRCLLSTNDPSHYIMVDDLKFQPFYSSMTSITYDPISQKPSSITNNSASSCFLTYDGLNRLSAIYDNEKKIIFSKQYNVVNDQALSEYNFEKTTVYNEPHTEYEFVNNLISSNHQSSVLKFNDGLGRTLQMNYNGMTPDHSDLIIPFSYDEYGRRAKSYLMYSDGVSSTDFRVDPISDQQSFYQSAALISHTNMPFSETLFNESPLNQILEVSNAGEDWSLGNHTLKNNLLLNSSFDNVINWDVNGNIINGSTGFIGGLLWKNVTTDENGNDKITFSDKLGRTVLERQMAKFNDVDGVECTSDETGPVNANSNNGSVKNLDTYYVYNEKGELSIVIPPGAIQNFKNASVWNYSISDPEFYNNVFIYKYDSRGRCITKKIPGQEGENYFVYDWRNQLVMSQSPEQFDDSKWNFIKYDVLGRNILNGVYYSPNSDDRQTMQNIVNQNLSGCWESITVDPTNIFEYTDVNFPNLIGSTNEILSINYFDNYDWNRESRTFIPFGSYTSENVVLYGLKTGVKDLILDPSNPGNYLTDVYYYDSKFNLIQVHSKHILNDWDIESNQFLFNGLNSSSRRDHNYDGKTTSILTRYYFDHASRLIDIFKDISYFDGTTTHTDNEIHMDYLEYNVLGQLVKKSLHYDWKGTASYLQDIDYRYNIRGWLTSINNSELVNDGGITNSDDFDAFGERIFYNTASESDLNSDQTKIQAIPQFNGNVSAVKWKVKSPYLLPSRATEHLYTFRYDELNRMTAGFYASDENISGFISTRDNVLNFDELMNYDYMGNIVKTLRNNLLGNIDRLSYEYDNNKLINVTDLATQQSDFDFHDQSNSVDYVYRKNGSLSQDNNKALNITFNNLNLVSSVENLGKIVDYIYSGTGKKLKKITLDDNSFYISGIEYKEDLIQNSGINLSFVSTEEGRFRFRSSNAIYPDAGRKFVFDYFLKDHLGSVRAVLSEEEVFTNYFATMEQQNSSFESAIFKNVDETRQNKPLSQPTDPVYSPDLKVSSLDVNVKVGVAKSLKVIQGDRFDINVKYFFDNTSFSNNQYSVSDLLSQIASSLIIGGNSPAGNSPEAQAAWAQSTYTGNADVNDFITSSLGSSIINDPSKPQGFLVYMFFDDKFKFYPECSGVLQTTDANVLKDLGVLNLKMPSNGFLYIYTNNESSKSISFNNLAITHYAGVLLEENHYYPYGSLMEGLTPSGSILGEVNNDKYLGKKLEVNFGMNQLDLGARMYDPILGRFNVLDPLAELAMNLTGYRYGFNNPMRFSDPSGLFENDDERDTDEEFGDRNPDPEWLLFKKTIKQPDEKDREDEEYMSPLNFDQIPVSAEAHFDIVHSWSGSDAIRSNQVGQSENGQGNFDDDVKQEEDVEDPNEAVNPDVKESNNGGAGSLEDMQKNPPKHPDYKSPKGGDRKVKNPNGKGSGWIDDKGRVWVPSDNKGNHAPHWDRQKPGGGYENIYPSLKPIGEPTFRDRVGEMVGLSGTALTIYLIISEGSRLFPPRNLVPIP